MKNELIQVLDKTSRLSLILSDCGMAAVDLARAHLSGPTASAYLAQALASVSLLADETSLEEETVTFRMEAPGTLGGFLVEATKSGTLRGYTKTKILNDLDGEGRLDDGTTIGGTGTFEVIRSVPGKILGSGSVAVAFSKRPKGSSIAQGLEAYYNQSLQRRVRVAAVGAAGDDGAPVLARGVLLECAPDGDEEMFRQVAALFEDGTVDEILSSSMLAERTFLKKIGLSQAEIRARKPLSFACRCSRERVEAMVASLPPEARAELAQEKKTVDVTCHMCGRTWSVGLTD